MAIVLWQNQFYSIGPWMTRKTRACSMNRLDSLPPMTYANYLDLTIFRRISI